MGAWKGGPGEPVGAWRPVCSAPTAAAWKHLLRTRHGGGRGRSSWKPWKRGLGRTEAAVAAWFGSTHSGRPRAAVCAVPSARGRQSSRARGGHRQVRDQRPPAAPVSRLVTGRVADGPPTTHNPLEWAPTCAGPSVHSFLRSTNTHRGTRSGPWAVPGWSSRPRTARRQWRRDHTGTRGNPTAFRAGKR